jgi:alkylation response protein AidB-like acyl-CoA dehydrogenase
MDFATTPEQDALCERIAAFARDVLDAGTEERNRTAVIDRDLWRRCGEEGVLGSCVPEAYGGRGRDVLTTVLMMEALGRGCRDNGLTLGLNGQMWAVQEPILRFGSEAQKRRYLPKLCAGEWFGAHGMTEEASGSDTFALQTTALRRGDDYVLNGTKLYIGLGPVCDVALVFASTQPERGKWGISAFLVDGETPGLTRGPTRGKMGLQSGPFGDLVLEDCAIPETQRLGQEGAGLSIFNHSMEWERSFIFASHIGSMARQLDEAVAHAKQRRQFGQPIGRFQSVSNRVADMKLRLETAQLMLHKAAWLMDQGGDTTLYSALAKLHLGESFLASSVDAMRIHGARGYLSEFGIERDLRDAAGGVIYSGTSDIQRQLIAKLLGL